MELSDLELMRKPNEWPQWPVLPVKRYPEGQTWPEVGIMVEGSGEVANPKVWLTNMFTGIKPETKAEDYKNLDEVIAAGWVVD